MELLEIIGLAVGILALVLFSYFGVKEPGLKVLKFISDVLDKVKGKTKTDIDDKADEVIEKAIETIEKNDD